jgi:hypothetical protein
MRQKSPILLVSVGIPAAARGGIGGAAADRLAIVGPEQVVVGQAAEFTAKLGDAPAADAAWTVEPADAGRLQPVAGPATRFTATRAGQLTLKATVGGVTAPTRITAAAAADGQPGRIPLVGAGYGGITIAIVAVTVAAALTALGVLDGAALATLLGTVVSYFFVQQRDDRSSRQDRTGAGDGANPP